MRSLFSKMGLSAFESRKKQKQKKSSRQRGMTLIEIAIGLGVATMAAALFAEQMAEGSRTTQSAGVAGKLNEVYKAAHLMVAENFDDILDEVGSGSPLVIPVGRGSASEGVPSGPSGLPSLQEAGYLSESYIDRNGYDQRHVVLIRQPDSSQDRLSVLVTTWGGNPIPDNQLAKTIGFIGSHGGAMLEETIPGMPANTVMGAYGGWQTPSGTWNANWSGNTVTPSVGRAMAHFAMSRDERGIRVNELLHRYEVAGHPELNEMAADLSMGSNDISDINHFHSTSGRIGQDLDIDRDLSVGRNTEIDGTLGVDGAASFNASIDVANDATVGGDLTVHEDLEVMGDIDAENLHANNMVTSGGGMETQGGLRVHQNTEIAGRVAVNSSIPTGSYHGNLNRMQVGGNLMLRDGGLIVDHHGASSQPFLELRKNGNTGQNIFLCGTMSGNENSGVRRLGFHRNYGSCDNAPQIYFDLAGPGPADRGSAHFEGNVSTGYDLTADRNLEVGNNATIDGSLTVGSDITANDIYLEAAGHWASEAIHYANIVRPGNNVPRPSCRSGMSPMIFLSPVTYDGGGRGILGIHTSASSSGANWTTRMEVYTPNAAGSGVTSIVNHSTHRVMVLTKCA